MRNDLPKKPGYYWAQFSKGEWDTIIKVYGEAPYLRWKIVANFDLANTDHIELDDLKIGGAVKFPKDE